MNHPPPIISLTTHNIFQRFGMVVDSDDVVNEIFAKFNHHLSSVLSVAKSFQKQSHEKKLTVADLNESFKVRGFKPFLGYNNRSSIKYENIGQVGNAVLSIPIDRQIRLSDYAKQPLKETPTETFFSFHWLAVFRGQQPLIAENIADMTVPGTTHDNLSGPPPTVKFSDQSVQITSTRNEVSQELYSHYYNLMAPNIPPLKKLPLLRELQQDAAVTPLLPYFFHHLMTNYSINDRNIITTFEDRLNLARSLVVNPNLRLEMYLIQLINLSITALLMGFNDPVLESYTLRENAAELLNLIIKKYSDEYTSLRMRITDYLVKTFIDRRNTTLQIKLGAAIGLSVIGAEVVRKIIIPQFPRLMQHLEDQNRSTEAKILSFKFRAVLLKICGDAFHADTQEALELTGSPNLPVDVAEMYNCLIPYFGTELFMYASTKDL